MNVSDFFKSFNTPHQTVPFSQISEDDYIPLLDHAIKMSKENLQKIIDLDDQPTFENTIESIELHNEPISKVASVFFNLLVAHGTDKMQEIAKEFQPKVVKYSNEFILNEDIFKKIKVVYDNEEHNVYGEEENSVLNIIYKEFVRNGALLNNEEKERITEIDKILGNLTLQYSENILKDKNDFVLELNKESDIDGLPKDYCDEAKRISKSKKLTSLYAVTLDSPSTIPFMKYSTSRALREKLYLASSQVGYKENKYSNTETIKEIVTLRHERANLFGFDSHASYVLEERMAKTPSTVVSFLNEFIVKAKPHAIKEIKELTSFAKSLGHKGEILPWDFSFYSEKLRKEKFSLDDEVLRPYFKLENVLDGAFQMANKLYGLTYKQNKNVDVYHEDVTAYEVYEGEKFIGMFYADFFPRTEKKSGAWATSYNEQYIKDGVNIRPHTSIVCNFTKPSVKKPSLLTFSEVTTLFHEFGHSLHMILSNCNHLTVSGANVFWDFVELPSQIHENWAYEKECLELFAKHYETNEDIPFEMIEKIKESSSFLEGYSTMRQVSFSLLDLAWHSLNSPFTEDVEVFEKNAMEEAQVLKSIKNTCFSSSFSHIFSGGYSAGYYSYKWAEVLDAEAFERFKENGIFDNKTALSFRDNILSRGGSADPLELFIKFNGKKPSVVALLKRGGLVG